MPDPFKYPGEENFHPIYDKGAIENYKSNVRVSSTSVELSKLKFQLSQQGLTDKEWMKALSHALDRYVQRLPSV